MCQVCFEVTAGAVTGGFLARAWILSWIRRLYSRIQSLTFAQKCDRIDGE
jgi:hypothetical protein